MKLFTPYKLDPEKGLVAAAPGRYLVVERIKNDRARYWCISDHNIGSGSRDLATVEKWCGPEASVEEFKAHLKQCFPTYGEQFAEMIEKERAAVSVSVTK